MNWFWWEGQGGRGEKWVKNPPIVVSLAIYCFTPQFLVA